MVHTSTRYKCAVSAPSVCAEDGSSTGMTLTVRAAGPRHAEQVPCMVFTPRCCACMQEKKHEDDFDEGGGSPSPMPSEAAAAAAGVESPDLGSGSSGITVSAC